MGIVITAEDAAKIKGMAARGDRQHDLAVYWGVNQGRINEIIHSERGARKWKNVPPATEDLPPPGPYVVLARSALTEVERRAAVADVVVKELQSLLQKYADLAAVN